MQIPNTHMGIYANHDDCPGRGSIPADRRTRQRDRGGSVFRHLPVSPLRLTRETERDHGRTAHNGQRRNDNC